MNGHRKAWPYLECGRKATITCLDHRASHRSENVLIRKTLDALKGNVNRGLLEPLIILYGYHLSGERRLTGITLQQTADSKIAEVGRCTPFNKLVR